MIMTETKTYKKTKTKTQRHRQRQKQSASKTHCMLYFLKARGSRISKMAFSPKISTKTFPPSIFNPNLFTRKVFTTIFHQIFSISAISVIAFLVSHLLLDLLIQICYPRYVQIQDMHTIWSFSFNEDYIWDLGKVEEVVVQTYSTYELIPNIKHKGISLLKN